MKVSHLAIIAGVLLLSTMVESQLFTSRVDSHRGHKHGATAEDVCTTVLDQCGQVAANPDYQTPNGSSTTAQFCSAIQANISECVSEVSFDPDCFQDALDKCANHTNNTRAWQFCIQRADSCASDPARDICHDITLQCLAYAGVIQNFNLSGTVSLICEMMNSSIDHCAHEVRGNLDCYGDCTEGCQALVNTPELWPSCVKVCGDCKDEQRSHEDVDEAAAPPTTNPSDDTAGISGSDDTSATEDETAAPASDDTSAPASDDTAAAVSDDTSAQPQVRKLEDLSKSDLRELKRQSEKRRVELYRIIHDQRAIREQRTHAQKTIKKVVRKTQKRNMRKSHH